MNSYPPWVRVVIHNGDMANSGLGLALKATGREARRAQKAGFLAPILRTS